MFDFYTPCTQHTRLVTVLHPETPSSWPEMRRQAHEADSDTRPYRGASEKPVLFVVYRFLSAWTGLRLRRRQVPADRPAFRSQALTVEQNSTVRR